MRVYRVQVASKNTGATEWITVEAETEGDARKKANDADWLVASVEEAPPVVQPPAQIVPSPTVRRPGESPGAATVIGIVLMVVGFGRSLLQIPLSAGDYSYHTDRFRDDNAVAATANSVEKIESKLASINHLSREFAELQGVIIGCTGIIVLFSRRGIQPRG